MDNRILRIDLVKLLLYLLKHCWLLLICGAIGFGLMYYNTAYRQPDTYTASGTMYVANGNPNRENYQYTNTNDLATAVQLLDTYTVVMKSDKVMNAVAEQLQASHPGITPASIVGTLSMGSVSQTGVFRVSSTTLEPRLSLDICTAVLEVVPDEIIRVVGAGSIEIIDLPEEPKAPNSRSPLRKGLTGAMAGMVLAAGVLILLFLLNRKVKDAKELTESYTPPVLASIRRDKKRGEDASAFLLTKKTPKLTLEQYASLRMIRRIRSAQFDAVYHCLSKPIQSKMRSVYLAGVAQSVQQQHEGNCILARVDELGLKCIALKGWELQKLYPHQNMRQMADIDILFKDYKYQKVKDALVSLGYSSEPESSWMHDNFVKGKITVEAHKRLTDDSGIIQRWEAQMWDRAICAHNNVYKMSKEDYYIYHFIHLYKDFKGGMLGLRRIIDTWLLSNNLNVNMIIVKKNLCQMGIQDFHNRIVKLCNECFGNEPLSEDSEVMIKHAFKFGIYGTDQTYKLGCIASMSRNSSMSLGMFRSAISAVFLPYSRMKAHFPILMKYPFLLLVCWIKRTIRILRGDNKRWAVSKLAYGKLKQEDYEEMKRFLQAGGL